jgi:hypothetical protein
LGRESFLLAGRFAGRQLSMLKQERIWFVYLHLKVEFPLCIALNDFHAKHRCHLTEVFHLEFGEEAVLGVQQKGWTGGNHAVIEMDGNDGDAAAMMKNIDAQVTLKQFKTPGEVGH